MLFSKRCLTALAVLAFSPEQTMSSQSVLLSEDGGHKGFIVSFEDKGKPHRTKKTSSWSSPAPIGALPAKPLQKRPERENSDKL